MKTAGLFTRTAARKAVTKRKPEISPETMKRLGVDAVKMMNPAAKSPAMEPSGSEEPLVYILGEAPGAEEDENGRHFVGRSGRLLRENLPSGYKKITRFNHCCRTRPPNKRPPTDIEIEAFRASVEKDIAETKPKVVIGMGMVPFTWALGKFKKMSMKVANGRLFPIEIAGHRCWMMVMYNPSFLIQMIGDAGDVNEFDFRNAQNHEGKRDQYGEYIARAWRRNIDEAYALAESGEEPEIITVEEAKEDVEKVFADYDQKVIQRLEKLVDDAIATGRFSADLETSRLRPYYKDAKIVSISVASKAGTFAFCVDHPKQDWGPNKKAIWKLIHKLCSSDCVKIFHNLPFDLEWLAYKLNDLSILIKGKWRCTQAQAYILDERVGGHSLQFLSTLRFGLRVKDLTNVNRITPQNEEPGKLLLYNGIDSKITLPLYLRQRRMVREAGQTEVEQSQQDRIPFFVMAQILGFPVKQARVESMTEEIEKRRKEIFDDIQARREVGEYKKRFGIFNPSSPDQVVILYRDIMGKNPVNEDGKFSSDESVLERMGGKLSKLLLLMRKTKKFLDYLATIDNRKPEASVYDDGKVHCTFNLTLTNSGRTSSEDPNMQNFPKRDPDQKRTRRCFVALPGHGFLAADHGQLEYRVIGILSKDKVVVESCFTEYDVHMTWAKKIAKAYPQALEKRYGDLDEAKAMKAFRGDIKNEWVFPQFYGASFRSCARSIENMPERIASDLKDEFWDLFHGVRDWQLETVNRYNVDGYVEAPNGRRRHGPMSYNMIINMTVQGYASDIVVDGMIRLGRMAIETGEHDLAARLNIHDDLTSMPRIERINWSARKMVRCMLACEFPSINVPLKVELSAGKDWENMTEVGRYRSDQLDSIKTIDVMSAFN